MRPDVFDTMIKGYWKVDDDELPKWEESDEPLF